MSCVSNVDRFSSYQGSASQVAQSLSSKMIQDKLRGIDAFAIELIAIRITTKILERLGSSNKFEIEQGSNSDSETPDAFFHNLMVLAAMTKVSEEEEKPFLSQEETSKFLCCASDLIKKDIQNLLSTPPRFLTEEIHWELSDYYPQGILAQTAEKIGLQLSVNDVPAKYSILFKLDENLTQLNSDLVFHLTEISDKKELSNDTFTIPDLLKEFGKELSEKV